MALNPHVYSTRSLSLILLAAFAGMGLWLLAPWSGQGGAGKGTTPNGPSASAALPPSLRVEGAVTVTTDGDVVTGLVVPLSVSGDSALDLDGASLRAETAMSDTASATVPATYSVEWRDGNGDNLLDPGEHAVATVTLPGSTSVHPQNPLRLVFRLADGGTVVLEDVLGR